jgi:aldehyde dehydrogenase (NAD+)
MSTFDSFNPVTGTSVGQHAITSKDEVDAAVASAREVAPFWHALDFKGRKKVLLKWSDFLLENISDLVDIVSLETGKPTSDATLEASLAISHLGWAARHAEEVLRTAYRSPGLLMANMSATVERNPLGVVGVIGPWNYPVYTPMGSISYALAAGNTVVFKPSEYTPAVGKFLADSFLEATGLSDVFICVTGLGETGKYLCESGVNKLAFTGSTATAKRVAATCALTMTPVVLECGGKDPVIVDRDADLQRAADATIWSAMSNAGQTCIGAERVYVHEDVAEQFIDHCLRIASSIKPGEPGVGNYGPATMPKQLGIIEGHIKDAIAKGGRVLLGGAESVHAPYVDPVIIADVPEDSTAITEETFGPTLVINRVATMQEAIALTNASRYGLGASVWSKRNGRKIARSLECGMVAINSVISFAAIASIPFGGVKDSGYGRIHGPEGILEFTYPRSVVRTRFHLPIAFTSFKRTAASDQLIIKLNKLLKGRFG